VLVEGTSAWVEDLGSKNGTWVNGQRIAERTEVPDGAEIRFGPVAMWLRWTVPAASTETIGPIV